MVAIKIFSTPPFFERRNIMAHSFGVHSGFGGSHSDGSGGHHSGDGHHPGSGHNHSDHSKHHDDAPPGFYRAPDYGTNSQQPAEDSDLESVWSFPSLPSFASIRTWISDNLTPDINIGNPFADCGSSSGEQSYGDVPGPSGGPSCSFFPALMPLKCRPLSQTPSEVTSSPIVSIETDPALSGLKYNAVRWTTEGSRWIEPLFTLFLLDQAVRALIAIFHLAINEDNIIEKLPLYLPVLIFALANLQGDFFSLNPTPDSRDMCEPEQRDRRNWTKAKQAFYVLPAAVALSASFPLGALADVDPVAQLLNQFRIDKTYQKVIETATGLLITGLGMAYYATWTRGKFKLHSDAFVESALFLKKNPLQVLQNIVSSPWVTLDDLVTNGSSLTARSAGFLYIWYSLVRDILVTPGYIQKNNPVVFAGGLSVFLSTFYSCLMSRTVNVHRKLFPKLGDAYTEEVVEKFLKLAPFLPPQIDDSKQAITDYLKAIAARLIAEVCVEDKDEEQQQHKIYQCVLQEFLGEKSVVKGLVKGQITDLVGQRFVNATAFKQYSKKVEELDEELQKAVRQQFISAVVKALFILREGHPLQALQTENLSLSKRRDAEEAFRDLAKLLNITTAEKMVSLFEIAADIKLRNGDAKAGYHISQLMEKDAAERLEDKLQKWPFNYAKLNWKEVMVEAFKATFDGKTLPHVDLTTVTLRAVGMGMFTYYFYPEYRMLAAPVSVFCEAFGLRARYLAGKSKAGINEMVEEDLLTILLKAIQSVVPAPVEGAQTVIDVREKSPAELKYLEQKKTQQELVDEIRKLITAERPGTVTMLKVGNMMARTIRWVAGFASLQKMAFAFEFLHSIANNSSALLGLNIAMGTETAISDFWAFMGDIEKGWFTMLMNMDINDFVYRNTQGSCVLRSLPLGEIVPETFEGLSKCIDSNINAAYIINGQKLFYLNKSAKYFCEVPLENDEVSTGIQKIRDAFNLSAERSGVSTLEASNLEALERITKHKGLGKASDWWSDWWIERVLRWIERVLRQPIFGRTDDYTVDALTAVRDSIKAPEQGLTFFSSRAVQQSVLPPSEKPKELPSSRPSIAFWRQETAIKLLEEEAAKDKALDEELDLTNMKLLGDSEGEKLPPRSTTVQPPGAGVGESSDSEEEGDLESLERQGILSQTSQGIFQQLNTLQKSAWQGMKTGTRPDLKGNMTELKSLLDLHVPRPS
jgi:hypothetical protein